MQWMSTACWLPYPATNRHKRWKERLQALADEYDAATAAFVALQLEFAWPPHAAQTRSR